MTRPGVEAWIEHTTPFERVRSIALAMSQSKTAGQIAEEAAVPVEAARKHLEKLVNQGILLESTDRGMPMYRADPDYTRSQTIQELLDTHDEKELIELRDDLLNQIETWQNEHDVETPNNLRARHEDTDPQNRLINHRTINEWEIVEYRLNIVNEILER